MIFNSNEEDKSCDLKINKNNNKVYEQTDKLKVIKRNSNHNKESK